jgi:hypothetical protein
MAQIQQQGGLDALIGMSTDTVNMFFASLAGNGELRVPNSDAQGCFSTGATVNSLLPADCESIDLDPANNNDDLGNATLRGYCHAIKGDNCGTLTFAGNPDVNLTAGERGVCFGASGVTCADVFAGDLVLLSACSLTPNFNIHGGDKFSFCATGDIPVLKLPATGNASVKSDMQINDISVSLVLDRGGNGNVDADLATLPGCFSGTQNTSDCSLLAACLDVNMTFTLNSLAAGNSLCEGGKAGIQAQFSGILPNIRKIGEVCAGSSTATTDDDALDQASSEQAVTQPIGQNAQAFAPPMCGAGLEVPNLFTCDSLKVLGLDTAVQPGFREFLALTCDIH